MARQGRVQVEELAGPVPLQAAPLPGDTFTGAAQAPIDNSLTRIADALSSFNSSLSSFGTAAKQANLKALDEAEGARANKMIAGWTPDQAIEAVQNGTLANFQHPHWKAAVEKNSGQAYGERIMGGVQNMIKTGQIDLSSETDNISDIVTKATNDELQNVPPWFQASKAGMAGLMQRIEAGRDQLIRAQTEQRAAAFTRKQEGVVYDQFSKMFDVTQGDSAEITQSKIRGVYADLGNSKFLRNDQVDKVLIDVLRNKAADPNSVEAVVHALSIDRVGKDGEKVPALGANPRYVQDITQIRDTARATLTKKYDETAEATAKKNVRDAIDRQDGSVWTMNSTSYENPYAKGDKTRTIDMSKTKDAAAVDYLTWSKQLAGSRRESPENQYQREWNTMTANNMPNPAWTEMLSSPSKAFANPQSLTNPVQRQQAIASGELFMRMSEANYPYVKNTLKLDKNALDFNQVYQVARQLGKNEDQSLDMAAAAIRTPDNENDMAVRSQRAKDVEAKVKSMDFGTGWQSYIPFNNSNAKNSGAVQKRILDVATVLVRVPGMSLDDAVKGAAEMVQKRSVYVNGHVVADNGYMPPKQLTGNIEKALADYHAQYGKKEAVGSASDLSIEPMGGGTFRIIDASQEGGKPLYAQDAKGRVIPATITMAQLTRMQKNTEADTEVTREAAQVENRRAAEAADAARIRNTPDRLLSPAQRETKRALGPDPALDAFTNLNGGGEMIPPQQFEDTFKKLFQRPHGRLGKQN
jgi:hypothetical protein